MNLRHNLPFAITADALAGIRSDLAEGVRRPANKHLLPGLAVHHEHMGVDRDGSLVDIPPIVSLIVIFYGRHVPEEGEYADFLLDGIRLIIYRHALETSLVGSEVVLEPCSQEFPQPVEQKSHRYRIIQAEHHP
ncbi:hypothetical protein [Zavarzinella formosa]|uniref:hypothetical protein n=1 Tax=Zavarzinella formosa TaxID=360055 RepID=UPI0012F83FF6|nr:hypothetical protein [Zavarzinella formosa]